jgi:hypothetical protein
MLSLAQGVRGGFQWDKAPCADSTVGLIGQPFSIGSITLESPTPDLHFGPAGTSEPSGGARPQ